MVSCVCGADVRVDPMNRDRRVTCRNCGNTFDFAVTMDSVGHNSRISLILPRGALKPEGESLATSVPRTEPSAPAPEPLAAFEEIVAPPPPEPPAPIRVTRKKTGQTIQTLMGHCECGAVFPLLDTGELTTMQSCPQCNRSYHVVFRLIPGTRQKTAMIVPEKPVLHRRMGTTAPSKAPKGATKTGQAVAPPEKSRTRVRATKAMKPMTVPAQPKPPPEVPVGAQSVACSCGEIFVVRRKEIDQERSCSGCGRRVTFQESRHPQTLAPILRIKPL